MQRQIRYILLSLKNITSKTDGEKRNTALTDNIELIRKPEKLIITNKKYKEGSHIMRKSKQGASIPHASRKRMNKNLYPLFIFKESKIPDSEKIAIILPVK